MLFDEKYKEFMSQFGILTERCVPPLEVLDKYKDDDNAFISFTQDVEPRGQKDSHTSIHKKSTKIGINPWSEYDTPIGVYFYPIKPYWDNLESFEIAFAGSNPHIYIVKAKNPDNLLYGTRYTKEDYQRDKDILQEIFPNFSMNDIEVYEIDNNFKKSAAQTFWSLTREIAKKISTKTGNKVPIIWTQILRRFYDGVVDDGGWGFIHSNEPTQAVIWTKAQFDVVDYVDRTCRGRYRNPEDYMWKDKTIDNLLLKYIRTGKIEPGYENEIKNKWDDILSSPSVSYKFAKKNLQKINIPEEIIQTISKDPGYSFSYAVHILDRKNVPLNILKSITQSPDLFHDYLDYLDSGDFDEIPEELIESISESPKSSYIYAKNLLYDEKEVPEEIVKAVTKNPRLSREYSRILMDREEEIPEEIINSIAQDPDEALYYATSIPRSDNPPDIILKTLAKNYYSVIKYIDYIIYRKNNPHRKIMEFIKSGVSLEYIPADAISFMGNDPKWAYRFLIEILIPLGIDIRSLFDDNNPNSLYYSKYYNMVLSLLGNPLYVKEIAKKIFKWKNLPPALIKKIPEYDLKKITTPINSESFTLFDRTYKTLLESFTSNEIDMNKAYEIFNQEYMQSTGKSWTKDKFLQRARNWEFWGDENGFVATRNQNSGFVKLVGAAGSDKSKYKGFKELTQKNLPVWGMVDVKIAGLLKKMGYRGPNMVERMAFKSLLKSGKMDAVLGGAKLESIKDDEITLTYPDVGTVTKYFMGSPQYWKKMHVSIFKK